MQIKLTAEAFFACKYTQADSLLGDLPERTQDKYIRISTLYEGCMIDMLLCNTYRFFRRYGRLCAELQGDFPFRTEMQEYLHEIDATMGFNAYYYYDDFRIIPGYHYHKSFLSHLACLSAVSLTNPNGKISLSELKSHELNCIFLENSDNYFDLQALHTYLGTAYSALRKTEEMTYHFTKVLELAQKYDLFYIPAIQFYYLRQNFTPALQNFPDEFKTKLTHISNDLHVRFQSFLNSISVSNIYKVLGQKDFVYLYAIMQGYTRKETAYFLHISESSVQNHCNRIYNLLGVHKKSDILDLLNSSSFDLLTQQNDMTLDTNGNI